MVSGVFDFTTVTPTVLLVDDDDDGPDVGGTYNTILNALVVFDTWNVTTEGSSRPRRTSSRTRRSSGSRATGSPATRRRRPARRPPARAALPGLPRLRPLPAYLVAGLSLGHGRIRPQHGDTAHGGQSRSRLRTSDTGDYTRVDGLNIYGALVDQNLTYPFTDFSTSWFRTAPRRSPSAGIRRTPTSERSRRTPARISRPTCRSEAEALPAASRTQLLQIFLDACDAKFGRADLRRRLRDGGHQSLAVTAT
ncbi:MAG: hypothetical protein R2862_00720 [Thermoanaerobaculia bacterium]